MRWFVGLCAAGNFLIGMVIETNASFDNDCFLFTNDDPAYLFCDFVEFRMHPQLANRRTATHLSVCMKSRGRLNHGVSETRRRTVLRLAA